MKRSLVAITLGGLILSGWAPHDRLTWLLEVAPVLIGLPVLLATYRRFPLSNLLYALLTVHGLVLMLGGAYTYAQVPFGFWLQDVFGFDRNPYDRIGHFAQGFVPAMLAREILIRKTGLDGPWLAFLCVCVVMFVSSSYELLEWWSALGLGQGADQFLGTQGDPFDTQADMFMAMIGASLALVTLSRVHDASVRR